MAFLSVTVRSVSPGSTLRLFHISILTNTSSWASGFHDRRCFGIEFHGKEKTSVLFKLLLCRCQTRNAYPLPHKNSPIYEQKNRITSSQATRPSAWGGPVIFRLPITRDLALSWSRWRFHQNKPCWHKPDSHTSKCFSSGSSRDEDQTTSRILNLNFKLTTVIPWSHITYW